MASSKILDTKFTGKWLENIISSKIGVDAVIDCLSCAEIGHGSGIMSKIIIVKIKWRQENEKLPISVVLKIPTISHFEALASEMPNDHPSKNQNKETLTFIEKAHKCETAVYELFRNKTAPNLKVPKSFFGSDSVLVLEDLSKGATVLKTDGLNLKQLLEVAEQIAILHAFSLNNIEWRQNDINMNFETFGAMPPPHEMLKHGVKELIEWNQDLFEPLAEKCLSLCKSADDAKYLEYLNEKMGLPEVFCHGDLHAQNMIWVSDDSGKATDDLMAVIDWQFCHPGNIGEDFARCFTSSVSADIRRNHFLEVLHHYYDCLSKILAKQPPYSFEQLLESYKRCFRQGAVVMLSLFPRLANRHELWGENAEQKIQEAMLRCKALIEDSLAYEREFAVL